jgi:hypothetical protein
MKHLKFYDSNKNKTLSVSMSYLKENTQAFPQRVKACSGFRLRSPFERGTMPASPSNGFLLSNSCLPNNLYLLRNFRCLYLNICNLLKI